MSASRSFVHITRRNCVILAILLLSFATCARPSAHEDSNTMRSSLPGFADTVNGVASPIAGLVKTVTDGMVAGGIAARDTAYNLQFKYNAWLNSGASGGNATVQEDAPPPQPVRGSATTEIFTQGLQVLTDAWPQEQGVSAENEQEFIAGAIHRYKMKRLQNKLKRYNTEFGRCVTTWIKQIEEGTGEGPPATSFLQQAANNVTNHELLKRWQSSELRAAVLPLLSTRTARTLQPEALLQTASQRAGDGSTGIRDGAVKIQAPLCLYRLVHHLSLEKDEYMDNHDNTINPLVRSYSEMHLGAMKILAAYPNSLDEINYKTEYLKVGADYAVFILDALLETWNAIVCRKTRMTVRRSKPDSAANLQEAFLTDFDPTGFKKLPKVFRLKMLVQVPQPNVGQHCLSSCGIQGWCTYCGGKGVGACCNQKKLTIEEQEAARGFVSKTIGEGLDGAIRDYKRGTTVDVPPECERLEASSVDAPVCTPIDCIQKQSSYVGEASHSSRHEPSIKLCIDFCEQKGAVKFDYTENRLLGDLCRCFTGEASAFRRQFDRYSSSGPLDCPDEDELRMINNDGKKAGVTSGMDGKQLTDVDVCGESPVFKGEFGQGEKGVLREWIDGCIAQVVGNYTTQFHEYTGEFASYLDELISKAGCDEEVRVEGVEGGAETMLSTAMKRGEKQIFVESVEGFAEAMRIVIGTEKAVIEGMTFDTLFVTEKLKSNHARGEVVMQLPDETDFESMAEDSISQSLGHCDWKRQHEIDEPSGSSQAADFINSMKHSAVGYDYESLKQMQATYPMPLWLHSRRAAMDCLKAKSSATEGKELDLPPAVSQSALINMGLSISRQVSKLATRMHIIEKWYDEQQSLEV